MYILELIVKDQEDSHIKRNNHSTGFDPIRQTERRGVPYVLTLHLRCVCHFSKIEAVVLRMNQCVPSHHYQRWLARVGYIE